MPFSTFPSSYETISGFGTSITALATGASPTRVVGIEVANPTSVAAHWLVITNTNAAPVSGVTPTIAAFYNPGTAGFQDFYDSSRLKLKNMNGYTVIRSSTPTFFTALGAVLAAPSYVAVTRDYGRG